MPDNEYSTTARTKPPLLDLMTAADSTAELPPLYLVSANVTSSTDIPTTTNTAAPVPPDVAEPLSLLYIVTGVFGALFIILPLFVRKGPNQGIIRCSIWLTVFSLWIFWATVYISQMRPLVGPRMHRTTVIWIKYAWANKTK